MGIDVADIRSIRRLTGEKFEHRSEIEIDLDKHPVLYVVVASFDEGPTHYGVGRYAELISLTMKSRVPGGPMAVDRLRQRTIPVITLLYMAIQFVSYGDDASQVNVAGMTGAGRRYEILNLGSQGELPRLKLSTRTRNALLRHDIRTIEAARNASDEELLSIRNFGVKCVAELRRALSEVS